jgi:hypothetical protein
MTTASKIAIFSQDQSFDTPGAAQYLGLSVSIMTKWRVEGRGPVFCKLSRRVTYKKSDLDAWRDARRRVSTSDDGRAAAA